jgi:serine protease Do
MNNWENSYQDGCNEGFGAANASGNYGMELYRAPDSEQPGGTNGYRANNKNNKTRRNGILKAVAAVICSLALVFGGWFAGARITEMRYGALPAGGEARSEYNVALDQTINEAVDQAVSQAVKKALDKAGYPANGLGNEQSDKSVDNQLSVQPGTPPAAITENKNGGGVPGLLSNVNPSGAELQLTELFKGATEAVVAISTETTGRNVFGRTVTLPAAGSGFIISGDGYIVTNNHVIENAGSISVLLDNGNEYPATLVGRDSDSDLAVLKIEANNLSYLSWGDSGALEVGEQVAAIGNPLGEFANSMTVGYISALDREINIDGIPRNMLQTDTAVNEGNSGGPLLSLKGRVIGIVSAKSSGMNVEGLGFAIPSNLAKGIVEQLIQNGYVRRAVMGVQVGTVDDSGVQSVYVESVNSGSAAENAGVKAGDIILSTNGTAVSTVQELKRLISAMSPGDTLNLKVKRDGSEITLTVILDESKPSDTANIVPPAQQDPYSRLPRYPDRQPQNPDQQQPQDPNQRQQQDPYRQRQYSDIPDDLWEMFPGMEDILPQ